MSKVTAAALTAALATTAAGEAFEDASLPSPEPDTNNTITLSEEDLAGTTFDPNFNLTSFREATQDSEQQEQDKKDTYVVKEDDTLWSIAREQLGDPQLHKELQRINPEIDPTDMEPGTTIRLKEGAKIDKDVVGSPKVEQESTQDQSQEAYTPTPYTEQQVFNWAMVAVFGEEGGLNTDPNDPGNKGGKATNLGVIQTTYDTWRESQGKEKQSVRKITQAEAIELYEKMYWKKSGADRIAMISPGLALMHFDTAINNGVGRAVLNLQEALGVKKDGKLGNKTLAAIRGAELDDVIGQCLADRMAIAARPHLARTQPGLPGRYQAVAFMAITYQDELPPQSSAEREARKAAGLYTPSDQFVSDCCDVIKDCYVYGAIRKGAEKQTVAALQRLLNHHARATVLKADGNFGAKTDAQVRAFQEAHGLKADGIVGKKTLAALVAGPS